MKTLYLTFGFVSLGLGVLGSFLPVLPTTPFAILAAFCFSKSSPKMEAYVLELPVIGALVKDWRKSRVIRPKAKVLSVIMIVLVMGSSFLRIDKEVIQALIVIIGVSVISFILTRKSK